MTRRSTRSLAVVALAGALLAPAGTASAGTSWNSLSGTAVTATQNGTSWSSVYSVPRCSEVDFWTRVRALLGSGECR